jgi:hypothetical protein
LLEAGKRFLGLYDLEGLGAHGVPFLRRMKEVIANQVRPAPYNIDTTVLLSFRAIITLYS